LVISKETIYVLARKVELFPVFVPVTVTFCDGMVKVIVAVPLLVLIVSV